jgi:hypothetical protein
MPYATFRELWVGYARVSEPRPVAEVVPDASFTTVTPMQRVTVQEKPNGGQLPVIQKKRKLCPVCKTESLVGKQTVCSNACRQKRYRSKHKSGKKGR